MQPIVQLMLLIPKRFHVMSDDVNIILVKEKFFQMIFYKIDSKKKGYYHQVQVEEIVQFVDHQQENLVLNMHIHQIQLKLFPELF
jgi:Holliday junction resolvase